MNIMLILGKGLIKFLICGIFGLPVIFLIALENLGSKGRSSYLSNLRSKLLDW